MSGKDLLQLSGAQGALAEGGSATAAARAEAETKVMIVMAHQHPRDEQRAYQHLALACTRPSFAESAMYAYPRGKNDDGSPNIVDGLSIGFAKEAARVWGNVQYGVEIVGRLSEKDAPPHGRVDIVGWAWDLQTNVRVTHPATFKALIYRRGKGWVEPDERDFRELVARHGAIAMRNAILNLIPPDVKEDLLDRLRNTGTGTASKDLEANREGVVKALASAFSHYGVTEDMLCHYLAIAELSLIDAQGLSTLRGIYRSIRDGATQASQHFPELGGQAAAEGDQSPSAADADAAMDAVLDEEGEEPEPERPEPEEPKAAPKKRKKKKAPEPEPEPEEEDEDEDEPEIRVHEGSWVGDLPKVSDYPAVIASLKETFGEMESDEADFETVFEQVLFGMYEREDRTSGEKHLASALGDLGYEV